MCYPVWDPHIKEPLLLIGKSSLCGGSGFPFSLSEGRIDLISTTHQTDTRIKPDLAKEPQKLNTEQKPFPRGSGT